MPCKRYPPAQSGNRRLQHRPILVGEGQRSLARDQLAPQKYQLRTQRVDFPRLRSDQLAAATLDAAEMTDQDTVLVHE